jgi:hypothetical protein
MSESPLRQQIAEAIHAADCRVRCPSLPTLRAIHLSRYEAMADAVLALLNLTEEWGMMRHGHRVEDQEVTACNNREDAELAAEAADGTLMVALFGPWVPATGWLPSHHTDSPNERFNFQPPGVHPNA